MEIKIEKIREGDSEIYFPPGDIVSIETEDIRTTDIPGITLNIQKNGTYIHITGSAPVSYSSVCDRCAGDYGSDLIINIDYFFHIGDMEGENADDIEIIYPGENNGILEFDPYLREAFFLSLPLRSLCSDDCKGLCPKCGKDLNDGKCECPEEDRTDPRWEKLTELLKKNK